MTDWRAEMALAEARLVVASAAMQAAVEEVADRDPVLAPFLAFGLPSYDGPRHAR